MSRSAWRAALRIARRDALRAKGRSLLIVAMIALPVVGVTGADVVVRSTHLSPQETSTRLMGAADAYVSTVQAGWRLQQAPAPDPTSTKVLSRTGATPVPTEQEAARAAEPLEQLVKEALPPGARTLPVENPNTLSLTSTSYGQVRVQTWGLDLADPTSHGIATLRQGSWPTAPHEVAASTAFLADAGLKVGQSTTLTDTDQPLRITAAVEFPNDLKVDRLVGRPGELSALLTAAERVRSGQAGQPAPGGQTGDSGQPGDNGQDATAGAHDFLVSLPGHAAFDWQAVQRANGYGFTVASRAVLADPPDRSAVPLYQGDSELSADDSAALKSSTVAGTVAGMALLEIVLLAGPAFAVGARRSRRQLALVAACGGDRPQIRRVVLASGLVLGAIGALLGTAGGALVVALGRSWLEARSGARFGHFALEPADLLGIVAVGVLTALLAAIVPAVQAARQPVVSALTGRVTVGRPAVWLTVCGALAAVGGTLLALLGAVAGARTHVVMAGSAIAELGLVACTPWLVSLVGKLARILPLGPRLAVRDAARNRGRTAPAVAAVMAAVAGAVAVLTFQSSSQAADRASYVPSAPSGAVVLQSSPLRPAAGSPATAATVAGAAARSEGNVAGLRAAVEHAIPQLGPRADLRVLDYGACDSTPGSFCGTVQVTAPKENVCPPAAYVTQSWASVAITTEEAKQLIAHDPRCRPGQPTPLVVRELVSADATGLHNLFGVDDPAAGQALAAGQVVVLDPLLVKDGKVTLALTRYGASGPQGNESSSISLPAVVAKATVPGARAVLSPQAAQAAGLVPGTYLSAWLPAHAPASAEEQRATAALVTAGEHGKLSVERGYQAPVGGAILLGLAIAASAVAIAAAGIATGLAAADTQGDLATLAAVGAGPGIRRRLSGFQCGAVAAMGALVGTAAGFVPAAAVQRVENLGIRPRVQAIGGIELGTHPLVVPWTYLAALVVGLPLLAWLLATVFTRSRTNLGRRAV
ncbi:hypothetical protein GCM10009665_19050 [Kitasatospora nipponensis]|uniref:ABC3 transporter permease C-terminal domain-containing protein n=1 Tax=Kitasatospora nipponensis TaxID=258049 RepID=A0ABN1VZV6_9ACTN